MISERARAKVNLCLHVTGKRADGYHLLTSLVAFPDVADLVEVSEAEGLSLTVDGPFGERVGPMADNLVMRAARAMQPDGAGVAIHLRKQLPVAAGIGGGSADAAAALRALSKHWQVPVPDGLALELGADVPVCLRNETAWMAGIGEEVRPVDVPSFWLVLVNDGTPVPTGPVFKALTKRDNPPPEPLGPGLSVEGFVSWLADQRNDLEPPALQVAPGIADVLGALRSAEQCLLARMSGSGGTCFGLFADAKAAEAAVARLKAAHDGWWVAAAPVA